MSMHVHRYRSRHLSPLDPLFDLKPRLTQRGCTFVRRDGAIVDAETGSVAGVGSACVELGVSYDYDADPRDAAERDVLAVLTEVFELTPRRQDNQG